MRSRKFKIPIVLASLLIFGFGGSILTSCQYQEASAYSSVTFDTNIKDGIKYLDIELYDFSKIKPKKLDFDEKISTGLKVMAVIKAKKEYEENCTINAVKLNSKYISGSFTGEYVFTTLEGVNEITVELDVLHLITLNFEDDPLADIYVSDNGIREIVKAKAGTELYLYILDNIKVAKDVKLNDNTIKRGEDGRYGFIMPDDDAIITITWGEENNTEHTIRTNFNGEPVTSDDFKITNSKGEEVTSGIFGETLNIIVNYTKYVSELKVNGTVIKESDEKGVFTFVMPNQSIVIDINWVNTISLTLSYNESAFNSIKIFDPFSNEEVEINDKKATVNVGNLYSLTLNSLETYSVDVVKLDGVYLTFSEYHGGYVFNVAKYNKLVEIVTVSSD